IVAVDDPSLLPASFDDLRFITDGAEVVADFQDGRGQPFPRHVATVIELTRQHHLEAPPLRAHRSLGPAPCRGFSRPSAPPKLVQARCGGHRATPCRKTGSSTRPAL